MAVRLIVEREDEIKKFNPQEYWDVVAELKRKGDEAKDKFTAKLSQHKGKKVEVVRKDEAEKIVSELGKTPFIVGDIKESKKKKSPYPPFTTSKLQQEAFNKM